VSSYFSVTMKIRELNCYFVVLSEELFKRATACSCITQEIQILLESVLSLSRYVRTRMP